MTITESEARRRAADAKRCVATWFDETDSLEHHVRPKLLRALEKFSFEVEKRSGWFEVATAALGKDALPIAISSYRLRSHPCRDTLAVTTIAPLWDVGLSGMIKDDQARRTVSWFLHYAKQYIHRSGAAAVLMVAWEEHKIPPFIFGGEGFFDRFGPVTPMPSFDKALEVAQGKAQSKWGDYGQPVAPAMSKWASRNTLDPFINQAIAHFIRAQQLRSQDFELEAIVALDCVVQSISSFLSVRGLQVKFRRDIVTELNLASELGEIVDYAYFVRNNFGAHVKGWRWWDILEMTEIEVDYVSTATHKILCAAADLEADSQRIELNPPDWGSWLFKNFELLWNAVWFRPIK